MMINFDGLTECPNCGVEFNKTKPNYNFCSYNCWLTFTTNQRHNEKIPAEVKSKWLIKNFIYSELWDRGYRPSLNWHRWIVEDEIADEFDRLMWRDA